MTKDVVLPRLKSQLAAWNPFKTPDAYLESVTRWKPLITTYYDSIVWEVSSIFEQIQPRFKKLVSLVIQILRKIIFDNFFGNLGYLLQYSIFPTSFYLKIKIVLRAN